MVFIVFSFRAIFYKFRYGEYFRFIERLNDYSYVEDAPWTNNVILICLIIVYLFFFYLIFDSYLLAFNYDPLGVLLLSWLTTIIVRSAHYSDIDAGKKISEIVTSFIFPIGIVIMAVYLKKIFSQDFLIQIEKNSFILLYLIAIVSLSFLLEISLGRKMKQMIDSHTKTIPIKNIPEPRPISIVEYTETLYSKGTEPKNKKSFDQSKIGQWQRTRWENVDTIEKNINGFHENIKKSDTDEKVDYLFLKKLSK